LQKQDLIFILAGTIQLMKKLLAVFCSALCIHSISQSPLDTATNSQKTSGEKVLLKAIAVIVNPQANKKAPAKISNVSSTESI
jgi:hypothetical protein